MHVRLTPESGYWLSTSGCPGNRTQLAPKAVGRYGAGWPSADVEAERGERREVKNDGFIGRTTSDGRIVPAPRGRGTRWRSRHNDGDNDRRSASQSCPNDGWWRRPRERPGSLPVSHSR